MNIKLVQASNFLWKSNWFRLLIFYNGSKSSYNPEVTTIMQSLHLITNKNCCHRENNGIGLWRGMENKEKTNSMSLHTHFGVWLFSYTKALWSTKNSCCPDVEKWCKMYIHVPILKKTAHGTREWIQCWPHFESYIQKLCALCNPTKICFCPNVKFQREMESDDLRTCTHERLV